MKTVILAGGFGTRISEESFLKPKPMIEIGGMPKSIIEKRNCAYLLIKKSSVTYFLLLPRRHMRSMYSSSIRLWCRS